MLALRSCAKIDVTCLRTLSGTDNIVQRIIIANPLCSSNRDIVRGCARRACHRGGHEAQVPGDRSRRVHYSRSKRVCESGSEKWWHMLQLLHNLSKAFTRLRGAGTIFSECCLLVPVPVLTGNIVLPWCPMWLWRQLAISSPISRTCGAGCNTI